jgi:hypothetical protein
VQVPESERQVHPGRRAGHSGLPEFPSRAQSPVPFSAGRGEVESIVVAAGKQPDMMVRAMPSPTPPLQICPGCGRGGEFRVFTVREMQFGTREKFSYNECPGCGTLHIAEVPADLSRFYPSNYYSFEAPRPRMASVPWLRRTWSRWLISSPDPLAESVARRLAFRRYAFFQWAKLCHARLDSAILDVGCGSGVLMRRMQRYGFTRLTGVDP